MEDQMASAKSSGSSRNAATDTAPRGARGGTFVSIGPRGGASATFVVKKTSFETLTGRSADVSELLERFAEAASRAKSSGGPVDFTIKVTPNAAETTSAPQADAGDALDVALAAAKARGAVRVTEILRLPGMLSARDFAPLVGMSHETVNQKRKSGELLGLQGATRGVRFPEWQVAEDGRPLPGLRSLSEILGGDPWTVYRFLTQRHNELAGQTALEALKAGRLEAVQGVARNISAGAFA
jgi:hypothetical protein